MYARLLNLELDRKLLILNNSHRTLKERGKMTAQESVFLYVALGTPFRKALNRFKTWDLELLRDYVQEGLLRANFKIESVGNFSSFVVRASAAIITK